MLRFVFILFLFFCFVSNGQDKRLRDYGIEIGVLPSGEYNAITDVAGVKVGHTTLNTGNDIHTGVTVILAHSGNIFQEKVPAAIYIGNGFGKLAGYSQVEELGNIETPIVLTNTLSVPAVSSALIKYTLSLPENDNVRSVNPVVGETNDGRLNNIRAMFVNENHVLAAIMNAKSGPVDEGNIGAGTGTVCFGYKGGIGNSSRVLPESLGGFTVGVLVQTNFGGTLEIAGVPVGKELGRYPYQGQIENNEDGSCMIVVATDAPLDSRNLKRLAKRAMLGLAKTGGIASNGSGDYVIAFSTAEECRISYQCKNIVDEFKTVRNDNMSPLFMATIEATEEAILNSLFAAESITGINGHTVQSIPHEKILDILKKYNRIQ